MKQSPACYDIYFFKINLLNLRNSARYAPFSNLFWYFPEQEAMQVIHWCNPALIISLDASGFKTKFMLCISAYFRSTYWEQWSAWHLELGSGELQHAHIILICIDIYFQSHRGS